MIQGFEAKAEMLIRRPPSEVFEAFIDPQVTTRFWFTKSSGRLEAGKRVTWEWEMYGVSADVNVKEIEKDKRILIDWPSYGGTRTTVEWIFTEHGRDSTFVSVPESGFQGSDEDVVRHLLDSTGGFTWLLAGAKACLEHGVQLNLTADAHPAGLTVV
jgi:uncharacterized protein YndB with AHSA1/START domain